MASILIGTVISLASALLTSQYIKFTNENVYFRKSSPTFEFFEFVQNKIDDVKLNATLQGSTNAEAALVAIDEESIGEIGRWPWSRDIMADITEEVLKYGAKSITFDVVFSEAQRDNLAADKKFGAIVEKYKDRIILGTASVQQSPTMIEPYKDICITEAFLFLGGQDMIKIPMGNTPRFVIDDQTEIFESARWDLLFKTYFQSIELKTRAEFSKERKLKSATDMTFFQSNALNKQISDNIFSYCDLWLTKDDYFMDDTDPTTVELYQEALGQVLTKESLKAEVGKIKSVRAHPIPQYLGWLQNIPAVQSPSLYTASFNIKPDADGIVRYYSLFSRVGNKTGSSFLPSLALQMYLHALQLRSEVTFSNSSRSGEKVISDFKIFPLEDTQGAASSAQNLKVDDFSRIRIRYYGGQKTFPHVSAKYLVDRNSQTMKVSFFKNGDYVEETVSKKEFLKDRTILFGATALGLYDLRNTPVANLFPGPEIHLNAFANLIDGSFIKKLDRGDHSLSVIVFVVGLLFTVIIALTSPLIMPLVLFGFLGITYGAEFSALQWWNTMVVSWPFYLCFIISFTAVATFKFFTEEKAKRKIRQAFSKYVSPLVVNELLKSDSNLALGGKKQRLAVFFSDLRGFTTFSESLDPQELSQFLNLYFNKMTDEIFKAKGTLDKFIGDAVMAFFGAPLPNENNSELACLCALNSIQRLEELNKELKAKKFPELRMGIGINTGEVSVGNMGSSVVQNYTVMGDAVNLASRLESLTSFYECKIIIGESTYHDVRNKFICRELDFVRVKGRSEVSSIYELITDGELVNFEKDWFQTYNKAREFYKNGFFKEALPLYKSCTELNKSDKASRIFLERCEEFVANPPGPDWDGVFNLRSK